MRRKPAPTDPLAALVEKEMCANRLAMSRKALKIIQVVHHAAASHRFMDRLTTDEADFTLNIVQDFLLLLCSYIMVTVLINCPRFLSSQTTAVMYVIGMVMLAAWVSPVANKAGTENTFERIMDGPQAVANSSDNR